MRQALTLILAACPPPRQHAAATTPPPATGARTIVVTTNILGDVVASRRRPRDVEVVMPLGADPHEFAPSARQAEAMAGRRPTGRQRRGLRGRHGRRRRARRRHDAECSPSPTTSSCLDGDDPHLWTDPTRMAAAVEALGARLAEIDGMDARGRRGAGRRLRRRAAGARRRDGATLGAVPAERRVLVTDHEVFGYFADRFDFEVLGAVDPVADDGRRRRRRPTSRSWPRRSRDAGVPAIFAETTSPTELADALADEVGDVDVVELFAESLGDEGRAPTPTSSMMRTNAELIAGALR